MATKKAAEKSAEPKTQVCLGACGKRLPIEAFGRTSKARGSKPMKRCKACIGAEAAARREAKRATAQADAKQETKAQTKRTAKDLADSVAA